MRKALLLAALVVLVTTGRAQQTHVRVPEHLKSALINIPVSETARPAADLALEPAPAPMRKTASQQPPRVANELFQIGLMANTFATIGSNRLQIACDPATNTVVAVHRGNDRASASVGNTIIMRYSSDHGATWSAPSTNVATSTSPRYPNVGIYNPTQSTTPADAKVVVLWPQVVPYPGVDPTWGEVNALTSTFAAGSRQYKKWPTPPNWSIPMQIMVANGANKVYTFADAVEPSNGQSTGGYHLLASTDGGLNWEPVNPNLDPSWSTANIPAGTSATSLVADVSRDGNKVIFAYIAIQLDANNRYLLLDSEHRIAYLESTDGGVTWPVDPTYISLQDLPNLPQPLNVDAAQGIAPKLIANDLDVVYDKYGEPHFLVSVSTDNNPYNPLASADSNTFSITHVDSTYICEVGRSGQNYYLNLISPLREIVGQRYSYTGTTGDPERIYHEPHWAVSAAGDKIYAKWVEVDSTLKHPYAAVNSENQLVLFSDTIRNAWVAGRHVDSRGGNMGWTTPAKVTNSTEVDVKYTKLAHFAGNGGEMHMVFTEWGVGERVDDDPNNSDNIMWYVKGVKVDAVLSVEKISDAPGDFRLAQNYPNPFNPSTTIAFTLPQAGHTSLKVYNTLGREVASVFDQQLEAGSHQVLFDASALPSGVYMYRLESGRFTTTRSMTLVK